MLTVARILINSKGRPIALIGFDLERTDGRINTYVKSFRTFQNGIHVKLRLICLASTARPSRADIARRQENRSALPREAWGNPPQPAAGVDELACCRRLLEQQF